MASLLKTYTKEKLKGQIFTPFYIAHKILDDTGYQGAAILGKSILDPACGDGRFLIPIVKRILQYARKSQLKKYLNHVYGWDIDKAAVRTARETLSELVGFDFNWNIKVCNALQKIQDKKGQKFDFIVGNPPYIRIQHLEKSQRTFIQKHFSFCQKGATDIYIAFYELCIFLLKDTGKCGLITPNTFFHTQTASGLRTYFANHKNLLQITNYHSLQIFENATTYSTIVIFDKQPRTNFKFQWAEEIHTFKERQIEFRELEGKTFWQLSLKNINKMGVRLGDICKISVGVTTLADKIYIMPFLKADANFVFLKSDNGIVPLEKGIVKPIVKASTLKNADEPIKEYIIFPYEKINGKHKIIEETLLKSKYPLAYEYLAGVKNILDKRDNGKPNKISWYAFGRSQGLDTSFGKKILFSPMNKAPNFIFHKNENATFYSGYCIKYQGDNHELLKALNSEQMKAFIEATSRDFRNGWKAYNKKIVQEFRVKTKNLPQTKGQEITDLNLAPPLGLEPRTL